MIAAKRNKLARQLNTSELEEKRNILILGNPLVGKPIATEHINALAMTNKLG